MKSIGKVLGAAIWPLESLLPLVELVFCHSSGSKIIATLGLLALGAALGLKFDPHPSVIYGCGFVLKGVAEMFRPPYLPQEPCVWLVAPLGALVALLTP